jgi:hypothetical protein
VLDSCGASFVSVTQSFNTQTSMGRLTLNVLLSFAQFERELTGERIRDKIAASKARGMWMGGVVPLGYDVLDRKLVVNAAEAETVRYIYQRYLALGSVVALEAELSEHGIVSKKRITQGDATGSTFSRGALYLLLQNRLYRGEICHKGSGYAGEHEAIVPAELFEQVQAQLERNRVNRSTTTNCSQPSLLAGLLWDAHGRPMTSNHCVKTKVKRYRYYVSRRTDANVPAWRVPAGDLEELIIGRLRAFLTDSHAIFEAANLGTADASTLQRTFDRCSNEAEALQSRDADKRRSALRRTISRVTVHQDSVELAVSVAADAFASDGTAAAGRSVQTVLQIQARLARIGKQMRLVLSRGPGPRRDPSLLKLIVKAWQARQAVERAEMTVAALAGELGYDRQYLGVLLRISYLAPSIIEAALAGQQPATLTRQQLARLSSLPSDWPLQQQRLGFEGSRD